MNQYGRPLKVTQMYLLQRVARNVSQINIISILFWNYSWLISGCHDVPINTSTLLLTTSEHKMLETTKGGLQYFGCGMTCNRASYLVGVYESSCIAQLVTDPTTVHVPVVRGVALEKTSEK